MEKLSIEEIFIRLILSMIFSGLIGYEREKNNSSAGLKTHILVSMGSTIIALIQIDTLGLVSNINSDINVRVDAVRLIAQVVSGIGFLGAGTIIITKRSIVGLTTAASIWGVSGIGLALGMGFYEISILGSLLILSVLVGFKRIFIVHGPQQILIKFISNNTTAEEIKNIITKIDPDYLIVRISTESYKNNLITTYVYRIKTNKSMDFSNIAFEISKVKNIISIESTEIV